MASGNDPKSAAELAENTKLAGEYATQALDAFQKQLKVITQMRDAMEEVAKVMHALCQNDCNALNPEVWKKVTKEVLNNKEAAAGAAESFKKVSTQGAKMAKGMIFTGAVLSELKKGFLNLVALGKGIIGFFASVAGGVFEVGKSILSIPFKMAQGLFKMASAGGSNELLEALENVRESFGDLKSESSRAIVDTAKNMEHMNKSGVPSYLIFGNLAGRIKAVTEMAVGMGAAFQVFQGEIEKNGTAIMLYQRGLGITNEQMATLASNALRMGKDIAVVQNEMTKQALGMSKAFGVNAKVISKDMAKAMSDLAHFGHLSTKEMSIAATFANKLGVSVDKLTAIMDQTATYDQAAEGMSKLNEQYGTNIDATEIMMAQNPADKLEILRKAFAATGKDMSKLTYQDRMFIKQQTGMGDELMNSAFAAKNAGVSLDKMKTEAERAEAATMSQTEAIKALGDSIKRTFPSGSGPGGGVMSHFLHGLFRGIQTSQEFIGMMMNIRQVLRTATQEGVKFGREFVNLFPGVKDIFDGIKEVFDPVRFRKMFDGLYKALDVFRAGGSGKIEDFISRVKGVFSDFTSGASGKKIIEGYKTFGKAVLAIVTATGEWIWKKMKELYTSFTDEMANPGPTTLKVKEFFLNITRSVGRFLVNEAIPFTRDAIKTLTSWLSNKEEFMKGVPPAGPLGKMMGDILKPLGDALKVAWEELYPVIRDLAIELMLRLKDGLFEGAKAMFRAMTWEQIATAATIQFGPAIGNALLGSLSRKLAEKALEKKISSVVEDSVTAALSAGLKKAAQEKGLKEGTEMLTNATANATTAAAQGTAAVPGLIARLGAFIATPWGAAIVIATGVIATAFATFRHFIESEEEKSLAKASREEFLDQIQDTSVSIDEKIREAKKRSKKLRGEASEVSGTGFVDAILGTKSVREQNLLAYADEADRTVKELLEVKKKQNAQFEKGTKEYEERVAKEAEKRQLDALGPVTIQNAAERFKQIDELAKKMMGKDFDIKDKLAKIKATLDGITWSIIDTKKEEELNKTFLQMQKIQGIFANFADIAGLYNVAVDKMTKIDPGKIAPAFSRLRSAIVSAINSTTGAGTDDEKIMGHYLSLTEVWGPKQSKLFKDLAAMAVDIRKTMETPLGGNVEDVRSKFQRIQVAITDAIMAVSMYGTGQLQAAIDMTPSILRLLEASTNISSKFGDFVKTSSRYSTDIVTSSIAKSLLAVEKMVQATQDMDKSLSRLDGIDISARLTKVAGAMGLGGSASKSYTVNSKEVVLNVTFNVSMDATELERVMIGNKNSIIRDRINFALDRGAKSDPNTKNALIKSNSSITGFYASDVPGAL